MSPLDAVATGNAAPDLHVESPDDRPHHGQIFLILGGHASELDRPATTRAGGGKRRLVGFIDPRRNGPSRAAPVRDAGPSSRPSAAALRTILREGGGLAEARAPRRVELLREVFVAPLQAIAVPFRLSALTLGARQLLAQPRDLVLLSLDQIVAFVAGRPRALISHTRFMADSRKKYKYEILDLALSHGNTR